MKFHTGPKHDTDLTDEQIRQQCKMYIAAVRIADDFGCDRNRHSVPTRLERSDAGQRPGRRHAEQRRPSSRSRARDGNRVLYEGEPLPHFNEVDECAGLDGLLTYRIHRAMGQPAENTLHDLRWGDCDASGTTDEYVWVFLISGSARPPILPEGGREPPASVSRPCISPTAAALSKGFPKPGEIVWSRIFIESGRLQNGFGAGQGYRTAANRKPNDGGKRQHPNGRSCTPSLTE